LQKDCRIELLLLQSLGNAPEHAPKVFLRPWMHRATLRLDLAKVG
jgi:hypothetical protein